MIEFSYRRLHEQDLAIFVRDRKHRQRVVRRTRANRDVRAVVAISRSELGLGDIGLPLIVPLHHDQLITTDHHGAAGCILKPEQEAGLRLLCISLQRPRLVIDVSNLDFAR